MRSLVTLTAALALASGNSAETSGAAIDGSKAAASGQHKTAIPANPEHSHATKWTPPESAAFKLSQKSVEADLFKNNSPATIPWAAADILCRQKLYNFPAYNVNDYQPFNYVNETVPHSCLPLTTSLTKFLSFTAPRSSVFGISSSGPISYSMSKVPFIVPSSPLFNSVKLDTPSGLFFSHGGNDSFDNTMNTEQGAVLRSCPGKYASVPDELPLSEYHKIMTPEKPTITADTTANVKGAVNDPTASRNAIDSKSTALTVSSSPDCTTFVAVPVQPNATVNFCGFPVHVGVEPKDLPVSQYTDAVHVSDQSFAAPSSQSPSCFAFGNIPVNSTMEPNATLLSVYTDTMNCGGFPVYEITQLTGYH